MIRLFHILFAVGCIGSIFVYSHQFTDAYIVPKWCWTLFVLSGILLCAAILALQRKSVSVDMSIWGSIIVFSCLLQAIYGILQYVGLYSSNATFRMTGSFDNPAGFAACLCAGLPFVGCLLSNHCKYIRHVGWLVGIMIAIPVILSYSRTGIVCIAVLCCLSVYERLKRRKVLKYVILIGLILLLFGGYWIKKNSADGRILIWKCGLEMVKDASWLGHGIGSFEAHYMDYQADYFRHQGLQHRYAMLADNVKQPFNEYLGILINWGIVGLLLLSGIISTLIYCYKLNPTLEKKVAFYCLISIAIFSCFSYPFTYPFTWIVLFLAVIILIGEYLKQIKITKRNRTIISILVMICSFIGIIKVTERIRIERDWYKTSVFGLCHSYDKALPLYANLEYKFDNNPYFLYNYAAVLSEDKHYEESLKIALKCRQYWADYDLELMIGENYQNLDNLELAEKYYNNAAMMCPSRFLPLYKLFHLYKENNNHNQAQKLAEIIINKPMKIKTPTILMMKREMKREIATLNEFTKKL